MKVFENDLVIGAEYWFDTTKVDRGYFIGVFNGDIYFYPIGNCSYPCMHEDGTLSFPFEDYAYEEV